jgi:CDP-4-dehydro-6-deoxyglucose reductase
VFGNRYEHDIIYRQEFEGLSARNDNFKHLFTLSQADSNWKGKRGYVQDAVPEFVSDPATKDFYVCGLKKMIEGVVEKLMSLGVPKEQIHYERYD